MIAEQYITRIQSYIAKYLPGYGKSIFVIANQLFRSTVREKKFYLAAIYFFFLPVLINLFGGVGDIVLSGDGIALFYAQNNTVFLLKTFFLSFFLGQILVVILTADQIAGEIEMKTFALLRSKPIYDSEIVIGKFFGMVAVLAVLDVPAITLIYLTYMLAFDASYPAAYFGTSDELFAGIIFVLLLQSAIIALTLVFSVAFDKSLYAILGSMLTLFIMSLISGNIAANPEANNYFSFDWILDAFLPSIFYHLEPLELVLPSLFTFVFGLVSFIIGLLAIAILILRNKEIP